MDVKFLKPSKFRKFKKRIFGFDIETANNNKDFVCASLVGKDYYKFFTSKDELINELKTFYIFRNAVIFATNLSFDFFGTFLNNEDEHFNTLFRGSSLLHAKTYFKNDEFTSKAKTKTKQHKSLEFIDSMNYASLSVAKMGSILKIPKLEKPDCLGMHPQNKQDWLDIEAYNRQDSTITYEFMKFLISGFESIGATFKCTIASTSMSLFRNKYLYDEYIQAPVETLDFMFESYYGGRCEAFARGKIKDFNYYDFNSLYPSIMYDYTFPNPNTLRVCHFDNLNYINQYDGCSHVDLYCPKMKYPLMPIKRKDGRLIFATGYISGCYTHIELRKALSLGYKVLKVKKTVYFLENIRPFQMFVHDLYSLRQKYQKEGSSMEYVVKICMNSLYGKFGQKYKDKDNFIHVDTLTEKDFPYIKDRIGNYYKIQKDSEPATFCVPIWASYISAYSRLKLYDAIVKSNAIYCDTDSIITKNKLPESDKLGALKLEMKISKGYIIRPKFYAVVDANKNEYVKIKGLGARLTYLSFIGLLKSGTYEYTKFTKFKEALRRHLIPNELLLVKKDFSLNDVKRKWESGFNMQTYEESEPINTMDFEFLTAPEQRKILKGVNNET